jgi:hypothetical protein
MDADSPPFLRGSENLLTLIYNPTAKGRVTKVEKILRILQKILNDRTLDRERERVRKKKKKRERGGREKEKEREIKKEGEREDKKRERRGGGRRKMEFFMWHT